MALPAILPLLLPAWEDLQEEMGQLKQDEEQYLARLSGRELQAALSERKWQLQAWEQRLHMARGAPAPVTSTATSTATSTVVATKVAIGAALGITLGILAFGSLAYRSRRRPQGAALDCIRR